MQHWSKMYLISASYMQLFFYPFLLQKEPCLRRWNHSSMSLFWTAIVLTGDPPAQSSCKFRYLSCEKRETLRSTRQSRKKSNLPSLIRTAKNARCCVQRGVVVRQNSTLIEKQLLFLKCCSSSGWIWTLTKIHWRDWWWELNIQGLHWDGIRLCIY